MSSGAFEPERIGIDPLLAERGTTCGTHTTLERHWVGPCIRSRGDSFECPLRFDIGLRAPFDCQEQVGGWEFFLHGIHKGVCIFGCFEFFLKN
jgi:hypothetical protein